MHSPFPSRPRPRHHRRPCGIESREQAFAAAERVARAGAQFFRGGAYKPRTSPYSFQGLGEEGLKIMAEIRDRFGLLIVTEAVDYESLDLVDQYADMIQIGARNMQNFSLLKRAGRATARPAEARHLGDSGRISDGRRIHHERGQLQHRLMRARKCAPCAIIPPTRSISALSAVQRLTICPSSSIPATHRQAQQVTPLARAQWPSEPRPDGGSPSRSRPAHCRMACSRCFRSVRRADVQVRQIAGV